MAKGITASTIITSQSVSAGSSVSSSNQSVQTKYGVGIYGTITNGATGPTLPMSAVVKQSNDGGTTYTEYKRFTANVTNSGTYPFYIYIDMTVKDFIVTFQDHTAQAVTGICYMNTVDSLT